MNRQLFSETLVAIFIVASLPHAWAQSHTMIIPQEAETTFGDSSANPFFGKVEDEQIFAAREFLGARANVITITQVAFRVNESSRNMLDATEPSLILFMDVFPGSMDEAVAMQGVLVRNDVGGGANLHLTGRFGLVDAFDVIFALERPFTYDRRAGQLVLSFAVGGSYNGEVASMDAQFLGGSFERGCYVTLEPLGRKSVSSNMLVTKFTYTIPTRIETVRKTGNAVEIGFQTDADISALSIEGSPAPEGPYSAELSAVIRRVSDQAMLATIGSSAEKRFFRIRLN